VLNRWPGPVNLELEPESIPRASGREAGTAPRGTDAPPSMFATIGYLTADLAVRVLPARVVNTLARSLARWAFALDLPARRALEANLARLVSHARARPGRSGAASREIAARAAGAAPAREAFEHFALSIADFLRLSRLERAVLLEAVEVRGAEYLAAACESRRGVIVLSAHIGSWEWGAAYLATRGKVVHLAARPHPSRWVERFFERRRVGWGVRMLRRRPLWLAAARALRRGEWVAMMGDRPAPGLRGTPCAWAAALARRTGAVVLPAMMLRLEGGRFAACFEAPLSPESCREGGYRDALLRHVAGAPGQWCAFEPLPEALA